MALVLMWTKQQCLAGPDNGGNVDQAEGFNAVRVGQLTGRGVMTRQLLKALDTIGNYLKKIVCIKAHLVTTDKKLLNL